MNQPHVLILGGTTEARQLASLLSAEDARGGGPGGPPAPRAPGGSAPVPHRLRVTTSLAGRTANPAPLPGELRTGGFPDAGGLSRWLTEHRVAALVDATHPFAARISRHAARASARSGVPLIALRRPGWSAGPGDDWHVVGSPEQAAAVLPGLGRRAFLTVGRTGAAAFAHLDSVWFLIRTLEAPEPPVPPRAEVLLDRGPFTVEAERGLLQRYAIDVLVTKDSGGAATAAKLTAAREAGLPAVVIGRPPVPGGVTVTSSPQEAADWVRARTGRRCTGSA
ncbi:cobalt-precorrin-6X reductase [Streptomyces nanshensis]|nr:cobalt-precorrin-6X reductase [Streptomyces nanshensis]